MATPRLESILKPSFAAGLIVIDDSPNDWIFATCRTLGGCHLSLPRKARSSNNKLAVADSEPGAGDALQTQRSKGGKKVAAIRIDLQRSAINE
jgi:hypothetical protein